MELGPAREREIVRMAPDGLIISRTRHGLVCANAGVDLSNVGVGDAATLLPGPGCVRRQRSRRRAARLGAPAVVVSDSFGRPWRNGIVNVAIGVLGSRPCSTCAASRTLRAASCVRRHRRGGQLASAADLRAARSGSDRWWWSAGTWVPPARAPRGRSSWTAMELLPWPRTSLALPEPPMTTPPIPPLRSRPIPPRRAHGRGGSAEVWRAHDEQLDRAVAVKRLHPHLLPDEVSPPAPGGRGARGRRARPPGDRGGLRRRRQRRRPRVVLELVDGESLAARLGRAGRLPEREAARIAAEVAEALVHAHQRGVVHRDVTPGNILLERDGRARLVDFGIARMPRRRRRAADG